MGEGKYNCIWPRNNEKCSYPYKAYEKAMNVQNQPKPLEAQTPAKDL